MSNRSFAGNAERLMGTGAQREGLMSWMERARQTGVRRMERRSGREGREERKRRLREMMKQNEAMSGILSRMEGLFKELKELEGKQAGRKGEKVSVPRNVLEEWKGLIDYFL